MDGEKARYRVRGKDVVNWEKAIQLFVDYEATVLSDGKKTALEKAESRARDIRYLLS